MLLHVLVALLAVAARAQVQLGSAFAVATVADSTGTPGAQASAFASAVAVGAGFVAVGDRDGAVDGNTGQGVVYVCALPLPCAQPAMLTNGSLESQAAFGSALAADASTLVVGASDASAAYVFTCAANATAAAAACTQRAQLLAADRVLGDGFGYAVAVSGILVAVGAPYKTVGVNTFQGAAYVFQCGATACSPALELQAVDGARDAFFGNAVAVSGEMVAVAAFGTEGDSGGGSGAVYLYNCSLSASFVCNDGVKLSSASAIGLGTSLALMDGGALVVAGAPATNGNQGVVVVFACADYHTCTQLALLTSADAVPGASFGFSVAASGTQLLVGSPNHSMCSQDILGAAYTFQCANNASACTQGSRLQPANGTAHTYFGYSVALLGTTALVGAPYSSGVLGVTRTASLFQLNATSAQAACLSSLISGPNCDSCGSSSDNYASAACPLTVCSAPSQFEQQEINATSYSLLGYAMVANGSLLLVGEPAIDSGYVHLYTCNGGGPDGATGSCSPASSLTAGSPTALFGSSIAVATAAPAVLVGAPSSLVGGVAVGVAFLFTCADVSACVGVAQLAASNGQAGDSFGSAVAISSDASKGFVAASTALSSQGVVYVFACSSSIGCNQTVVLEAVDPAPYDQFGFSIAVSAASLLAVGVPYRTVSVPNQGAVYVFDCAVGSTCNSTLPQVVVLGVSAASDDEFGCALAWAGASTLYVGARSRAPGGAVFVYTCAGSPASCALSAQLAASAAVGAGFGAAIATSSGGLVMVGASSTTIGSSSQQGAASIYHCSVATACVLTALLSSQDGGTSDAFGAAVAISDAFVAAGAPQHASSFGAIYTFTCGVSTGVCNCTSPNWAGVACNVCASGYAGLDCSQLCPFGQFWNGTVCAPCSAPCGTCVGSASTCTSCAAGSLQGSACVATCNAPTPFSADQVCVAQCPSTLPFTNGSVCIANCGDYLIQQAACVSSCSVGFYAHERGCIACDPSCATCQTTGTRCTSCSSASNTFLYSDSCVAASLCPTGTYADSASSTCAPCDQDSNCETCALSASSCTSCIGTLLKLWQGHCVVDCPSGTTVATVNGISVCQAPYTTMMYYYGPRWYASAEIITVQLQIVDVADATTLAVLSMDKCTNAPLFSIGVPQTSVPASSLGFAVLAYNTSTTFVTDSANCSELAYYVGVDESAAANAIVSPDQCGGTVVTAFDFVIDGQTLSCYATTCAGYTDNGAFISWPNATVSTTPVNGTCFAGYAGSPSQVCSASGWSAQEGQCVQCPVNCDVCKLGATLACSECAAGFILASGACVQSNTDYIFYLLGAVGAAGVLLDGIYAVYYRRHARLGATLRSDYLWTVLARIPVAVLGTFDTISDAFFILVVSETANAQAYFAAAVAFTVAPYAANLLVALGLGLSRAFASARTSASEQFAIVLLTFLSGDVVQSLTLARALRVIHSGHPDVTARLDVYISAFG